MSIAGTRMFTEGILLYRPSTIAAAEMICIFMVGGAVHLTYFAIANGKLSAKSTNLRAHYLNFIYSEWLDMIAHVVLMFMVVDFNPEWIFPGFEVQHILTSLAQIGIRIQMTKFMCQTMKLNPIWVWVMMIVPYIFRVAWCALMFGITFTKPIPGFNFFSLLLCEAVSFLYDLMIVKYADIVLVKNKPSATFIDLFWEVVHPSTSFVIIIFSIGWALGTIGEAVDGVGYLGAVGSMIASSIFYTYRSVLVESIDLYISTYKSSSANARTTSKVATKPEQ